ncbi:MAG: TIGR00282 family metallophosphoesterase [Arcobacter sp.]|uniref:TIGR00282 family metallophosphoesterase n=1 Tax=Arcobacter sp. TaxID=1872629 RepID=UPI003B002340
MKIAFIGDIVGRPGRKIIEQNLRKLKTKYEIDFIIANGENASHGFGLTVKNANELFKIGVDLFTGGNHTFDKRKEIIGLLESQNVIRPANYPNGVPGEGYKVFEVAGEKLAVINLMGNFSMPTCDNPFNKASQIVKELEEQNIKNIFIDFHAEATSEKRVMAMMFNGKVSGICGSHTHVGTDDLQVVDGTTYLTDIGLTGCRDNVIGMDSKIPIEKATTGLGGHFTIPNSCKSILQMIVMDIKEGKTVDAFKIKVLCDKGDELITKAIFE